MRRIVGFVGALLAACGGSGGGGGGGDDDVGGGDIGLTPATPPATDLAGKDPRRLVVVDFDGDGDDDLVTANPATDDVSVLLLTGAGTFTLLGSFAAGPDPQGLAVGLLDGDLRPDVVVTSGTDERVRTLRNVNGSSLAAPVEHDLSGLGYGALPCVVLADVAGDGELEAVVGATGASAGLVILEGLGTGAFGLSVYVPLPFGPLDLARGDLDGDALPDLAARGDAHVAALLGVPGNFALGTPVAVPGGGGRVVVGGFGGSAADDVATTNTGDDSIAVLLGDGAGGLAAPLTTDVGSLPEGLAAGDVNGDGTLDLLVAEGGANQVRALSGEDDGTFAANPDTFPVGGAAHDVVLGSFGADGSPDVAVARLAAVHVFLAD